MAMYWIMFGLFAFAAFMFNVPAQGADRSGAMTVNRQVSVAPLFGSVFLIAVIGLRYRVGGDWATYQHVFYSTSTLDLIGAVTSDSRVEPGYLFVNWVGGQLGAGVWFVNLVCAAMFTAGLMRICKQQPNPWLALVVATPFLIIVVAMGFTRQAAALGGLMLGIADLIERRSLLRFVAYVLLGSLFHRTVLFFVPVVLFAGARTRTVAILLAAIAVVLAYVLFIRGGGMSVYEPGYVQQKLDAAGARIRVAMNVVAALVLLFNKDSFYASHEEKLVWKTFAILAVICGLALAVVPSSAVVDRMAMYLIPLQVFVFSRLPTVFSQTGRRSHFLRLLVVLYSAAVLFVWLNYAVNAGSWIPYRSYLQGPA